MAEFSTSSLELGRFDKSGNVPLTDQTKGPESGRGTKSFQLQQFADYIGDAAKVGGNAYQAKLNREAAENARIRQIEAFAKQEKTRQENEAKVSNKMKCLPQTQEELDKLSIDSADYQIKD